MYRGLAHIGIEDSIDHSDVKAVIFAAQNEDVVSRSADKDLNVEIIGDIAFKISIIPMVREHLITYLKNLMQNTLRIIMEGRDIGTVVAPNSDINIFILADVEVRAVRQYK